jgi:hypothetical protein
VKPSFEQLFEPFRADDALLFHEVQQQNVRFMQHWSNELVSNMTRNVPHAQLKVLPSRSLECSLEYALIDIFDLLSFVFGHIGNESPVAAMPTCKLPRVLVVQVLPMMVDPGIFVFNGELGITAQDMSMFAP